MEHFEKAQQSVNPQAIAGEDPVAAHHPFKSEREGIKAIMLSMADCQAYLHKGDAKLAIISAQLPGFDAAQFSRWLRSEFPNKPVPVVLSFEPEDRLLTHPLRKGFSQSLRPCGSGRAG